MERENIIFRNKKHILKYFSHIVSSMYKSPTLIRRSILLFVDLTIICSSFFVCNSYLLTNRNLVFDFNSLLLLLLISSFIYLFTNQYKGILIYRGSYFFYGLGIRNLFITFIYFLISDKGNNLDTSYFSFFLLLTLIQSGVRLLFKDFLLKIVPKVNQKKKIVIFGAGEAGAQLASSLSTSSSYQIIAFIDDSKQKIKRSIWGIPIEDRNFLAKNKEIIDRVLFAIPSLDVTEMKKIFREISVLNLSMFKIPSIDEIISGKEKIDNLKPITIEDILGRTKVKPDKKLLGNTIKDNIVLVTGGGGSIGSEICRQIIRLDPALVIVLDSCEFNLYKINEELISNEQLQVKVVPVLGDVLNKNLLNYLFRKYNIDTVIHAAAYKHVPLVEDNPISGIHNNVISTKILCECVYLNKPKYFLLISSDKAVRPTNLMGASKRLSELIVQSYDYKIKSLPLKEKKTIFCIVRFGNVLGSSGSVVPLFQKQIANGGPLTITHPKVTRYFMTIAEASQLVLQASSLSKGGEIFLLDMGQPILIKELAEQMIKLSGKKIKNKYLNEGDIEIKYTGLRKGEKLYEELLISGKSSKTKHPLIFSSKERFVVDELFFHKLEQLEELLNEMQEDKVRKLIFNLIS